MPGVAVRADHPGDVASDVGLGIQTSSALPYLPGFQAPLICDGLIRLNPTGLRSGESSWPLADAFYETAIDKGQVGHARDPEVSPH